MPAFDGVMKFVSILFLVFAAAGLVMVAAQTWYVRRFLRRAPKRPARALPLISILKPLRGVDEGLEESLRSFEALDYPDYEVLLGLKSADDAALPLAQAMVARRPDRFRILFQQGEPGLNPKVNQLITLERAARGEILVVSDASVRVDNDYLPEIAAHFEDPQVALVTHPVAGTGERTLGALFDNLYITTHASAGPISTKELADQDIVLGKSMAFRRSDLAAMGGFAMTKDFLSEDYVLGRRVKSQLQKRVVIARTVVQSISERREVSDYHDRYGRWAILQRQSVTTVIYFLSTLVNPTFLATIGLLASPSRRALAVWAVVAGGKSLLDVVQMRMMRPDGIPLWSFFAIPMHDLLAGRAWFHGLLHDTVVWRGHPLRIGPGTRLILNEASVEEDDPMNPAGGTRSVAY